MISVPLLPGPLLLAGLALTSSAGMAGWGVRLVGIGLLLMAVWLLRYDLARRTVRGTGLTRFIAANLLAGYAWLAVSGLLALALGRAQAGPRYDAELHALFLGFVFSLIFAHAPVVFPAVMGVTMAYRPGFYAHVVVLHASLLMRIGGDLLPSLTARRWGGLLSFVAIVLFLAVTIASVRPAPRAEQGG